VPRFHVRSHWSDICRESWHTLSEEFCVICYAHESQSRKIRLCLTERLGGFDSFSHL